MHINQNETIIQEEKMNDFISIFHILIDKEKDNKNTIFKFFNAKTKEEKVLMEADEKSIFHLKAILKHDVYGDDFLFSIHTQWDRSYLYNSEGNQLFKEFKYGFYTPHGVNTHFESSKIGFGITYKKANTDYGKVFLLIDRFGNFYGEFYFIEGKYHNTGVKNRTICPKFFDSKILALQLPGKNKPNKYLTIINKDGTLIETKYKFDRLGTGVFNDFIIKDKKIFGEICLIVEDNSNNLILIDLNGYPIKNIKPLTYKKSSFIYTRLLKDYFISQKK